MNLLVAQVILIDHFQNLRWIGQNAHETNDASDLVKNDENKRMIGFEHHWNVIITDLFFETLHENCFAVLCR